MTEKADNIQQEPSEDLQANANDASITASADGNTASAGASAPEDTQPENPYEIIIEQQNRTIDTLIAQAESLNAQIVRLLQSGVQITDGKGQTDNGYVNSPALSDDYVPLSDLGADIGKRDK